MNLSKVVIYLLIIMTWGCNPSWSPRVTSPAEATLTPRATFTPTITPTATLQPYPTTEGQWQCDPSGGLTCFHDLNYVKMLSRTEGWISTGYDDLFHYSVAPGQTEPAWRPVPSDVMPRFRSLEMVSPTEGWAIIGDDDWTHLFRQPDGQWRYEQIDSEVLANDKSIIGPPERWICSYYHYHNGIWERVLDNIISLNTDPFECRTIVMLSPTDIWMGGKDDGGYPLYHYDGEKWRQDDYQFDNNYDAINDMVAVPGTSDIWAATSDGILHYYEGSWHQELWGGHAKNIILNSIDMVSREEGWAVGVDGMYHRRKGGWVKVALPIDRPLYSIDMIDATEGWAVGGTDVILHYHQGTWQVVSQNELSLNFPPLLKDIAWIPETNEGWAVGYIISSTLLHYRAGKWSLSHELSIPKDGLGASLRGIDLVSPTEGWAVGNDVDRNGIFLHYHEGKWHVDPTLAPDDLNDVDMWDEQTGLAVGDGGLVMAYQQGQWQVINSPRRPVIIDKPWAENLYKVVMVSADEAWVTGGEDILWHYQKGQWQQVSLPSGETYKSSGWQVLKPNSVWFMNGEGLWHYEGETWQRVTAVPERLSTMQMVSEEEGWFVGDERIWHYQHGVWSYSLKLFRDQKFEAIHMVNEHEGWMVGDAILHYTK